MCDSACRWLTDAKNILKLCQKFLKSPAGNKYRISISLCQQFFINLRIVFLHWNNKASVSFFRTFMGKAHKPLNLGSHQVINGDIWRHFLGDNFQVSTVNVSVFRYRQISLNIMKYRQISLNSNAKLFEDYRQKSSGFTANTITQLVITCSKLTIETLKQGVKYVRS